MMSGKEMRFQVPTKTLDSTAGSRKESGGEFQLPNRQTGD